MAEHLAPKKLYVTVFTALLILTGLTTAVAHLDLGRWNTPVALAIAIGKATLVALFFMHLRWSSTLMRLTFVAAILWLGIMIAFTFSDVFTRHWVSSPESWETSMGVAARPVGSGQR